MSDMLGIEIGSVKPRWGFIQLAFHSQGALRDPELCCETPAAFFWNAN